MIADELIRLSERRPGIRWPALLAAACVLFIQTVWLRFVCFALRREAAWLRRGES